LSRSFQIAAARGISIRVHPTFALVFVWVAYQWGISAGAGLTGAVFGSLVLLAVFGCVLLHEIAHAAVALRNGLSVRDITLLPFGGVARVEQARLSPRVETAVAVAGPVMNLIIAAALSPLVLLVAAARHLDHPVMILLYADEISVAGFILYIWIANILLALFNLIPAFPMDGGRILRAGLTLFRDRFTATRISVAIGQLFAAVLICAGFVLGDFILPLVGVFIVVAGLMESRYVRLESHLRKLHVGQFALWESGGIRPDVPLAHAIKDGPKDLVVTQNGSVIGMLWRRDVLRHLHGSHPELIVRDIMDRRVSLAEVTDSVFDVHQLLTLSGHSAVPVVQDGQYRGIFTNDRLIHVYEHINSGRTRWRRGIRMLAARLGLSAR
jgi:Zn-dependent protease